MANPIGCNCNQCRDDIISTKYNELYHLKRAIAQAEELLYQLQELAASGYNILLPVGTGYFLTDTIDSIERYLSLWEERVKFLNHFKDLDDTQSILYSNLWKLYD